LPAVLLDQAGRQRPGPADDTQDRRGARRHHRRAERGRQGHQVQHPPAGPEADSPRPGRGAGRRRGGGRVMSPPPALASVNGAVISTNLLANVLAMQTAVEAGGVEALLYKPDGTLTEGTHTSFFGVLDGELLTAPQSPAILPGITRGLLLRLARQAAVPLREH